MAEPELDAAILYYGRLVEDPEQLAGIEASVLGIFGERDRGIPPEAVERFADFGLSGFLEKPYTPEALAGAIREALAGAGETRPADP